MSVPVSALHIVAGTGALLSGAAALALAKGGRLHAQAGSVFVGAMALLMVSAAIMAIMKPDRISTGTSLFTLYLVVTSWMTARGRGIAGRFELFGFFWACVCVALCLTFGIMGSLTPNGHLDKIPATVGFVFAGMAALAGALDLNFLLRRTLSQKQRIGRHLWRMCAALLFSALSFFMGQQKAMPVAVQGSPALFLPIVAIMGSMIFWMIKTRFTRYLERAGIAALQQGETA
jgi:uncharacterized membrane protein